MVNYRYLGYGVTNDNGVAQLTHDANGDLISNGGGYVGTGAGELDVIASLDNPIGSGSVVSQPSTVLDCIFEDVATSNAKSSNYQKFDNTFDISYGDNGTTLTRASETYSTNYSVLIGSSIQWRDSNIDYCIEADVSYENGVGTGGSVNVLFGSQIIGLYRLNNNSATGSGHLKLITDGDTLMSYWNDVHISSQDKTMTGSYGLQWGLYKNTKLTFKNLKIYPI